MTLSRTARPTVTSPAATSPAATSPASTSPAATERRTGPDLLAPVRSAGTVLRCRSSFIALAAGLGLIVAATIGQVSTLADASGPLAQFTPDQQAHQLLGGAFVIGLFAAAAAAMSVVRDLGSGLYGAAVLRYPRRYPVVVIKAVEAVVVGAAFAVLAIAAAALSAVLGARLFAVEIPVLAALPDASVGVLLAVLAQSVIGSGVGWLIRRSAPAVLVLIGLIAIGEPGLMAAWPASTPYLLSGAAAGLMNDLSLPGRSGFVPALLVELIWVLVLIGVAALVMSRRDVPSNSSEDRS
jgi:hypothetical protein